MDVDYVDYYDTIDDNSLVFNDAGRRAFKAKIVWMSGATVFIFSSILVILLEPIGLYEINAVIIILFMSVMSFLISVTFGSLKIYENGMFLAKNSIQKYLRGEIEFFYFDDMFRFIVNEYPNHENKDQRYTFFRFYLLEDRYDDSFVDQSMTIIDDFDTVVELIIERLPEDCEVLYTNYDYPPKDL